MSTIKDVAKEAGVSIATVSRVINKSPNASEQSIKAVTEAMKKLSYRPNAAAKALVSQNSATIGVLVADVSDPFFGTLTQAVDRVARAAGKHTLIGNGYHAPREEQESIDLLINNRCDALIIHSKALSDETLISYAEEVKSLVLINRHIEALAGRCISLDNFRGAYLATEFLIKHGHTKIALISSNHDIEDAHERKKGFEAALRDNNISPCERMVELGDPSSDGGEEAMTQLLTRSVEFTAVVAYNDYMAAGAMSVAQENGINVPDDVSIVGFDDGLIARYVYPKLTTIRYPIKMMAEQATQLALQLSKGLSDVPEIMQFTPTLVRRDSVAPVRKK
ncbi:substrate-binding domain-containing protein [Enterovibrio norvegicus]|uniref:Substrate-binding domain-containing protein n=1 Tax=Enterovibrio norvegicus TaxID=188144 RepID=A0ABV4KYF8_9GAMM|nr:substrate-binding domain-containing protein [Enterovibrio norvegicus]OEF56228.1 DNA-binding transcriptional regulator GalS [Enterovibrio norvegicus]